MTDDPPSATNAARLRFSRRDYLVAAGGVTGALAAGYAGRHRVYDEGPDEGSTASDDRSRPSADESRGAREDFLWLGGTLWRNERLRNNLFAFARRHDLAVVLVKTDSAEERVDENVRPPLAAASEFGLDPWLNVGLLNSITAETFVNDRAARETYLERLRNVARAHGELFDGGRVVLWQEAPVMGEWAEGGEWNREAIDNLRAHGPTIFDAQKRAVTEANSALDVGIFVHFPYIVDSKSPDVFADLMDDVRDRDATPDFGFVDFYRGWYEKDVGPEPANHAVRSLISNARRHLDDRPVFYLGQCHTINPNHTPSAQAMRMNLRASLESGASGLGWYVRSGYVPTERGFDPFVPNAAGVELAGDDVATLTVARDRFLYAWLATLETRPDFAPDEAFDCWLCGDGFGFHDHRLSIRTTDGGWEFVGTFDGYVDGDYPYSDSRVAAFRGLSRDRFVGSDGSLELRIETPGGSDAAELASVVAMPCDPDAYVTEREAAALVDGPIDFRESCLGYEDASISLEPGETRRVAVSIDGSGRSSLDHLRHPDHLEAVRQLATFEDRTGAAPRSLFDLWMSGSGLDDPAAAPSVLDRAGDRRSPAEAGVVAVATDEVALFSGLERDRFLREDGDGIELADDAADGVRVDAAYAMPYAGSATFRSPSRVAELVVKQPDEVETFSLASLSVR